MSDQPLSGSSEALPPAWVHHLEQVCDRFQAAWKAGHRPRIVSVCANLAQAYSVCRLFTGASVPGGSSSKKRSITPLKEQRGLIMIPNEAD
jgi:hypothetical protein